MPNRDNIYFILHTNKLKVKIKVAFLLFLLWLCQKKLVMPPGATIRDNTVCVFMNYIGLMIKLQNKTDVLTTAALIGNRTLRDWC